MKIGDLVETKINAYKDPFLGTVEYIRGDWLQIIPKNRELFHGDKIETAAVNCRLIKKGSRIKRLFNALKEAW
jgi:hypothetical protein